MAQTLSARKTGLTRIIGHVKGQESGPVLIFFGGIHGNEPSGVQALEHVFKELNRKPIPLKGNVYGIAGNIPAILENKRFLHKDLNRIWLKEEIEGMEQGTIKDTTSEDLQLLEILRVLRDLLSVHQAPFYFIDFHTTSSKTLPFITINDAMINRKFARQFPVPIILGIEEYLVGPVLNYINEFGYVSLGFESGQHATEEARTNSIAFFWLSLVYSGAVKADSIEGFKYFGEELRQSAARNRNFYEITERYAIEDQDSYKMKPGFQSFERIDKGVLLAEHNGKQVVTSRKGILFMPLYQNQGAEGFFMIRKIPKWILGLSAILRKVKADHILVKLPGISWKDKSKSQLIVDLRVARFYSKAFFHLFGYRSRTIDREHLLIKNREKVAKNDLYKDCPWY